MCVKLFRIYNNLFNIMTKQNKLNELTLEQKVEILMCDSIWIKQELTNIHRMLLSIGALNSTNAHEEESYQHDPEKHIDPYKNCDNG